MRKLFVLILLLATTVSSFSQTKVWNDDRRPEPKADTSIVIIAEKSYIKIVSVAYAPVTEASLISDLQLLRDERRELKREVRRQAREDSIRIAEYDLKIEMSRTLYRKNSKALNLAFKNIDDAQADVDKKKAEREEKEDRRKQLIQGNVIANPRKNKE